MKKQLTFLKKAFLKITLKATVISGVLLVIYGILYISSQNHWIGLGENQTTETEQSTALFFTDIFPENLFWYGNDDVIVKEDNRILSYNIQERSQYELFQAEGEDVIEDYQSQNDSLYVATTQKEGTKITRISADGQIGPTFTLPKSDFIEFSGSFICLTSNYTISSPQEIATSIDIYNLDNPEAPLKHLQTTFTLKPLNCDQDNLVLIPSYPDMLPALYIWKIAEAIPEQISSGQISQIHISQSEKYVAIQNYDNEITIFNLMDKMQNSNTSNYVSWNVTNNGSIIGIQDDGSHILLKLDDTQLASIAFQQKIIGIQQNPGLDSFALISDTGELWILKL